MPLPCRYIYIICTLVALATLGWWSANHWTRSHALTPASDTPVAPADPLADVPARARALTIPALRERTYHSHLNVEKLLETGPNYRAYLASYDSDGARVYGLLTLPTGVRPAAGWPAIILLHGYINPSTYQTNGSAYRGWWQAAARDGRFAIFKPDMRGHGQSEGVATGPY